MSQENERIDRLESRLCAVEVTQAVNMEFKAQLIQLKWVLIGGVVALTVGVLLAVARHSLTP